MREEDRDSVTAETDREIGMRTVSGLRIGPVIAYSWLLAGAVVGVLNLLHIDLHEHRDLPPVIHWIRDASLAVPLAALAVVAAVYALGPRITEGSRTDGVSLGIRIAWAVLAAGLFAVLVIPGIQVHGLLFGAEEGEAVGWLEHGMNEGLIALQVSLAVMVPAALVLGPPSRADAPGQGSDRTPGTSQIATTGQRPSLVSTPTHVGGDR